MRTSVCRPTTARGGERRRMFHRGIENSQSPRSELLLQNVKGWPSRVVCEAVGGLSLMHTHAAKAESESCGHRLRSSASASTASPNPICNLFMLF